MITIFRIILSPILFPLSLIYGFILTLRNILYNFRISNSKSFNIPIVSVGNITVGGTGKTPHVEYLIKLLQSKYSIATLSRGYKRKTSGYILASDQSTAEEIGDEPMQIKQKFEDIAVAVDENRVHGVDSLLRDIHPDLILLDDAYQHRRITPGLSILLIDYSRPIWRDFMLPLGNLREPAFGKKRADIVIITKCPSDLSLTQKKKIIQKINPTEKQYIFFSTFDYGNPKPVFESNNSAIEICDTVISVTGIAKPKPFLDHIRSSYTNNIKNIQFPDHHDFTEKDLEKIHQELQALQGSDSFIFTTEKDAIRLQKFSNIAPSLAMKFFYIPIEVKFLFEEQEEFNTQIEQYVG